MDYESDDTDLNTKTPGKTILSRDIVFCEMRSGFHLRNLKIVVTSLRHYETPQSKVESTADVRVDNILISVRHLTRYRISAWKHCRVVDSAADSKVEPVGRVGPSAR